MRLIQLSLIIALKRHTLFRFRQSQSPADWQCYKNLLRTILLLFVVRKSPSSLLPFQVIPRSNFGEIFVPLTVHNPRLPLYLYTSEILSSWIIIFLILYLLRPIPLTLLFTYFPILFTFPRPSILLQSLPVISTIFLSTFAWLLPLDLSGRMLLLCLPQCLSWSSSLYVKFLPFSQYFSLLLETLSCSSYNCSS